MKHTPGPWKMSEILIGDYDEDNDLHTSRQCSHCIVAEHDDNLLITYALPPTTLSDEFYANGQLISAAPDLLAACQYVVDWHRENDSGEGELFGLDFVTTCISAIHKATE